MRALRLGSLLLTLLLTPAATLANNSADEADIAFELGNEAYARARYVEALRSYFTSYRLAPNHNVLFNIARCYEALGRYNEAYRYYNDLSQEALPEDAAEIARSLERLRPRVALVRVTTEPPGAEVYVNRLDLGSRGRSPRTLALPPGNHKVMVHKAGYRPAEATVRVQRGHLVDHAFTLERITGTVELTGVPAGAEVRESQESPVVGRLPGTLRLSPGPHLLHVSAPGYSPDRFLVDVPADGTIPLQVALIPQEKPVGRLIITSNRDNATVRVNGRPAGFTPTVVTLPEGEHLLDVESRETNPMRQRVTVVADQEVRLHAELRYAPPPVRAASKSLLSIDEAPASTTVLSQEELRAFGYTTLAEALAAVRGIFISDDRTYTYLGVRGFAPPGDLNTRVLILWDGHAVNDVWAGQGYSARDLAVDLEHVERIEVVRGPGSALYGTGAFFAVINVVPRDSLGPERKVEVTGAVEALGTTRLNASASWDDGQRSVLVAMAGLRSEGAALTPLGEGLPTVVGLDDERAATGLLRARLGGLSLQARLHGRVKQIPTGPFDTVLGAAGTQVADVRGFAEARYEKELGPRTHLSLRGAFDASHYRGDWMYATADGEPERNTDAGRADWLTGEARLRLTLFEDNHLTLGLESQGQLRVEQESFGEEGSEPLETKRRVLLSAYLLDEWRLHPRVSLSAGLRVDKYLDLDTTPLTPRLALIARPYASGLTKLVAGRAFRAPNVYELYYHDTLITQRASLHLHPEVITTFELEHAHDLTKELRLIVAGYHNRISNLVFLATDESDTPFLCGTPHGTEPCLVFANSTGETLSWGAEAGLHWQPGRNLLVDLSYSFVTLPEASEDVAAAAPAHLASGRLLLPLGNGDVRLAAQATYQSARGTEGGGAARGEALLLNLGLSGEFERFRYFAGVKNLLDARYALALGEERAAAPVPQYGRTFLLQLTGTY